MLKKNAQRIQALRESVKEVVKEFKDSVSNVGILKHDSGPESYQGLLEHDNVKIIEASSSNFIFSLDPGKHQVVVVLSGEWSFEYDNKIRMLQATDVIKIPINTRVASLVRTSEIGSKFLYVQFKE